MASRCSPCLALLLVALVSVDALHALQDIHGPQLPDVQLWRVVRHSEDGVKVLAAKRHDSAVLGQKDRFSTFRGKKDGSWLMLYDEPGYVFLNSMDMEVADADGHKKLLRRETMAKNDEAAAISGDAKFVVDNQQKGSIVRSEATDSGLAHTSGKNRAVVVERQDQDADQDEDEGDDDLTPPPTPAPTPVPTPAPTFDEDLDHDGGDSNEESQKQDQETDGNPPSSPRAESKVHKNHGVDALPGGKEQEDISFARHKSGHKHHKKHSRTHRAHHNHKKATRRSE